MLNNIPARGTTSRRILEYISGARSRTRESICKAINDIAKPAIDLVIKSEIEKGHIRKHGEQFFLTGEAKRKLEAEAVASIGMMADNFKPRGVQPRWQDNVMRPGATEFMDWQSKHY